MSCYVREKVLRIPFDKLHKDWFAENFDLNDPDLRCNLEFNPLFEYFHKDKNYFQASPTEEFFIDYVIDRDSDACDGEWGKFRSLTVREQEKYRLVFQQIDPYIDMNDVHLVEYCWYNGTEAPDYYDDCTSHDDFYDEI